MALAVVNRMHGTGFPRPVLKIFDGLWYLFTCGVPLLLGSWFLQITVHDWRLPRSPFDHLAIGYITICGLAMLWGLAHVAIRGLRPVTTRRLIANHTSRVNIGERLGEPPIAGNLARWMHAIPGNQILDLHIHEKKIELPRLDQRLDGLTITHLSDLHFTGQLQQSFYEQIVEQANQLDADLVAITGDIIDKPRCYSWITETLAKLKSRLGVFFVLGNHEQRLKDEARVRATLTEAGMFDAGSMWHRLWHNGAPICLAGNERPWFGVAPDMNACPDTDAPTPLRILLAHTPDLFKWSCQHDFDLMLAGHTHGGQIRFPIIGPIVSPSLQGTRYASGTFFHPPTLLHVSRGIAGTRPLRINCPPELTKLCLKSG